MTILIAPTGSIVSVTINAIAQTSCAVDIVSGAILDRGAFLGEPRAVGAAAAADLTHGHDSPLLAALNRTRRGRTQPTVDHTIARRGRMPATRVGSASRRARRQKVHVTEGDEIPECPNGHETFETRRDEPELTFAEVNRWPSKW